MGEGWGLPTKINIKLVWHQLGHACLLLNCRRLNYHVINTSWPCNHEVRGYSKTLRVQTVHALALSAVSPIFFNVENMGVAWDKANMYDIRFNHTDDHLPHAPLLPLGILMMPCAQRLLTLFKINYGRITLWWAWTVNVTKSVGQ